MTVILTFTGEDVACIQSTATNPAVCHDKVGNQQFAARSGSPQDALHLH